MPGGSASVIRRAGQITPWRGTQCTKWLIPIWLLIADRPRVRRPSIASGRSHSSDSEDPDGPWQALNPIHSQSEGRRHGVRCFNRTRGYPWDLNSTFRS